MNDYLFADSATSSPTGQSLWDVKVRTTEQRLLQLAHAFMNIVAPRVLSADQVGSLSTLKSDLLAFHRYLRQLPLPFIEAGLSGAYWCLIEAIGFFEDATNAHWPYMTAAAREGSLASSVRMIEAFGFVA